MLTIEENSTNRYFDQDRSFKFCIHDFMFGKALILDSSKRSLEGVVFQDI